MKSIEIKRIYSLQLANGHCWNLIATEGSESWVDKFAEIMQIKGYELDHSPRLVFMEDKLDSSLEELLDKFDSNIRFQRYGWETRKYSFNGNNSNQKYYYNKETNDIIFFIDKNGTYKPRNNGNSDIMSMWFASYHIYNREQFFGGLPFHTGLIELNGKGILISAKGGTGKSTCCNRIPLPWKTLADDQALIVRDNLGKYKVHPFPTWSEHIWAPSTKTWNVEKYVDLSAIFFLEQSKFDEVVPLERERSLFMIYRMAMEASYIGMINMDKEEERLLKIRIFNNSCELSKFVPTYILRASLHGQFWKEIEKVFQ